MSLLRFLSLYVEDASAYSVIFLKILPVECFCCLIISSA